MPIITARKTSAESVNFDPIVVREKERARLVFKPLVVLNKKDRLKPVSGEFVWQKKRKHDEWQDEATISLNSLEAGSGLKLALTTDEVHRVTQTVRALYGRFWETKELPFDGEEIDVGHWAEVAKGVGDPLELVAAYIEHNEVEGLATLLRVAADMPHAPAAMERVAQLGPDKLADISSLAGLATLRRLLSHWETNADNAKEPFWQELFGEHSFALSQMFATPLVKIAEKAYLGGKGIDNRGGKEVDFLFKNSETLHTLIVEIKTPVTELLGKSYRGRVYPPSAELVGAVAQAAAYRQSLERKYDSIRDEKTEYRVAEPRCLVVAGSTTQFEEDEDKLNSFELFRRNQRNVEVVAFNELYERLRALATMLEANDEPLPPDEC